MFIFNFFIENFVVLMVLGMFVITFLLFFIGWIALSALGVLNELDSNIQRVLGVIR